MLVNSSGDMRILSVTERELLLGFDKFYTEGAIKENPESEPSMFIRCQLLGCAFSCHVVAWLLDKLISSVAVGGSSTCVGRLLETGVSCRAWGLQPKFYAEKSDNTKEEIELVHQYLAIAEKNGSDVRLDLGLPFRPKAWPRVGLPPRTWHWRIIHGYPWKGPSVGHITELEFRAAFNTLRWRIRNCLFHSVRFLHLVDSQPCAAILTKGRTGSGRLRNIVRRFNATCLAIGAYPIIGYIHSEDNPADVPSRWQWREGKRARKDGLQKSAVKGSYKTLL
jgi:hypothetical protein